MQYQQTPQGLASMFGADVANGGGSIAATPSLMSLLGQQQNADQMTGQDQARQLDFDTQNDPLKLAHSGLTNDTMAAELPGVGARSSMAVRKNSNEALLNDQNIQDLIDEHGSKKLERHVKDMEQLGQTALQQYQSIYLNPFGGPERAKKAFADAGHGSMWNDDWNNLPAGELAAKLKDFGTGIQNTNAAMSKAMSVADAKAEASARVAQINKDREIEKTKMINDTKEAIAKLKAQAGGNPANLEKMGAGLLQAAQMETEPEKKKLLMDNAQQALDESARLKAAGAAVVQSGAVDLDNLKKGISARKDVANPATPRAGAAAPVVSAPPAASEYLKQHPEMAAQYDAKYGPGAASKILGR